MDAVKALSACLSEVSAGRGRAGVRHALRYGPIAGVARTPRLLAIAQEILGLDAFPFRATLFEKSSSANWLVVWHQDTALPLCQHNETQGWGPWSVKEGVTYAHAPSEALSKVLALRIHLDESTALNGPLHVLPGTHKLGVLDDGAIRQLAEQISPVECEVPMGGVLAMRPLLVHGSSKSRSGERRRVLHIEFAASPQIAEGLRLQVA